MPHFSHLTLCRPLPLQVPGSATSRPRTGQSRSPADSSTGQSHPRASQQTYASQVFRNFLPNSRLTVGSRLKTRSGSFARGSRRVGATGTRFNDLRLVLSITSSVRIER